MKIQNAIVNTYDRVFWSGCIRLMLELFYPSVLLAFLKITAHDGQSIVLPIMTLSVYIGFCVATFLHLKQSQPEIDTVEYKRKYGAYFTNVETDHKP